MLNIDDLASEINKAINATDAQGNKIAVTEEMKVYAKAIINTFKAATFAHTLVNGSTAPGSPLSAGTALNGTLVGFAPAVWQGIMSSGIPSANPGTLSGEAKSSTSYISGAAKINFEPDTITGTCTSSPTSPGPLSNGAGEGGKIAALVGAQWAAASMPPTGDPGLSAKIYNTIINYLIKNADCEYPSGSVTGVCPAGGGPLAGGIGAGGMVK